MILTWMYEFVTNSGSIDDESDMLVIKQTLKK